MAKKVDPIMFDRGLKDRVEVFNMEGEDCERLCITYIGVVINLGTTYNIQNYFSMESYFSIKVTPLGSDKCFLEEVEEG